MKRMIKRLLKAVALVLIVLLGLPAYTFVPMKLDVPADEAVGIFSANGKPDPAKLPEVTLSILKTGRMLSRQAFAWRGGSWGTTYESGMVAILVRHPQVNLLFDAGFGANVDRHTETMPSLMKKLASYVKEQPAADQLRQHGIEPGQIGMIFISHSHWDHVSGLEDFPGVEVRMPQAELEFIRQRRMPGLIDQMIDKIKVRTFDFTGEPYENFERSLDLFNDGSVVFVPLPGHTEGSTGMFVNLHSGKRFLFTGDLTWAHEGVQLPAERPWIARRLADYDEAEVRRSIIRVHQLIRKYPDLIVVPAHDSRVHERIASFPDAER
ncbi:MAG TPA: MBL fold metallo-hydrolase [Blastocatellia bacterium]|nr:MBL fold metallo-hydrolase [Blastocatellia bacterium]